MLKASYRLHEILSNSRSVLLAENYPLVLSSNLPSIRPFFALFCGQFRLTQIELAETGA
jgi:hypothetical protein